MHEIFTPLAFQRVADGTEVCAFLNPTDESHDEPAITNPLARVLSGNVSLAAGRIRPGVWSAVHTHPLVAQITYVTAGELSAKMQDPDTAAPYTLRVPTGSAMVTPPGTLLQLGNETPHPVEVLYIVSPSYVRVPGPDGAPDYDDSVPVATDWDEVTDADLRPRTPSELNDIHARRQRAIDVKAGDTS